MSALRAFAYGMFDEAQMTPRQFREMREDVRAELRREKLNMQIKHAGVGIQRVSLIKVRGDNGGKLGKRRRVLCNGTMRECCLFILKSMGEIE
jgi:hypothetical protein